MKNLLTLIVILVLSLQSYSQVNPFDINIVPLRITDLGGVQSFAFAKHNGKWLIIGGRLDGLHRRQPWASFDIAGNNDQLIVIDPLSSEKWSAPLSTLPIRIREQLSSTNMNFHQEGNYLYCVGGYGYSGTSGDHITYPNLTAITVSEVIEAVINNTDFAIHFRQIDGDVFQVTGGKLDKIYDTYYLLGGHKFMGRYNPMGPDHGPGFQQEYTNAIRRFKINDDGIALNVIELTPYVDSVNLHRRDYNAVAQILPNGVEGITMFSGVFQPDVDLPFLNSVTVDSSTFTVDNIFQQYYNHYHCATLPLYSESNNEMHTVFFGGIAQYYDNEGVLVKDDDVPFVKTIARVTRDANGDMAEYKLPIEMPSLLGAGSEFILNESIQHYENGVVKLDDILGDSILVGYIYGGISSSSPNIFWVNDGTQSNANSQIFKVYLIRNRDSVGTHQTNKESISAFDFQVYPNPSSNHQIAIKLVMKRVEDVKLDIVDTKGVVVTSIVMQSKKGENIFTPETNKLLSDGVYFITVYTKNHKATKKIIIQ